MNGFIESLKDLVWSIKQIGMILIDKIRKEFNHIKDVLNSDESTDEKICCIIVYEMVICCVIITILILLIILSKILS